MPRTLPHHEALLGPDSASWKLRTKGSPLLALGGARAALLQLAHPAIATGIADHSYVEANPYERVRRTGEAMGAISFGSRSERERTLRRLASVHRGVRGVLPTGQPYDATDPALMFFVLATVVDSNLVVEERYLGIFSETERRRYYSERLEVAAAFGLPRAEMPSTLEDFRVYMHRVVGELDVGELARRLGKLVLNPTFVRLPRPALGVYRLALSDLLPVQVRGAYGLREHPRLRPVKEAVQASSRAVLRRVPSGLRTFWLRPRPA